MMRLALSFFFFFIDPAPPQIYTLSLHDALPIFLHLGDDPKGCAHRALRVVLARRGRTEEGEHPVAGEILEDRKSTRLNSSHVSISYAVFCLKKKKTAIHSTLILITGATRPRPPP